MIDFKEVQTLLIMAAWMVPLITVIVWIIRSVLPKLNKRYAPALAAVIGIGLGLLLIQVSVLGAIVGLILGFSASGLWDLGKNTVFNK